MGADSRKRREYLGEALRIGYCNGRQLLKRLELFGITLEELEEAMSNYQTTSNLKIKSLLSSLLQKLGQLRIWTCFVSKYKNREINKKRE